MTAPREPLLVVGEVWAHSPPAAAVACRDGLIVAVGPIEACLAALPPGAREVGGPGTTVLPGFIDAHTHVFAAATAAAGIDCTPAAAPDIATLLRQIADAAAATAPGGWLRATGYEETMLAEGRHPTRAELDRVAPAHPVRLVHRSGHAEVLNSFALARVGIDEGTTPPPGVAFDRSLADGSLNGLLIGAAEWIEAAMPAPDPATTARRVERWAAQQRASGVTTFVDAGPRNGPREWALMRELTASGRVPQLVSMMEPVGAPGSLGDSPDDSPGDAPGDAARLVRGPSKSMPRVLEHEVAQTAEQLAAEWGPALARDRRIAVHANTPAAVAVTLDAFALAGAPAGQRIEHAPLLPPPLLARLATSGHWAVAQPGLLLEVPRRYRTLIGADERRHLHPWARLLGAGGRLAASSDAPVSRGTPLESIAALSVLRQGGPAGLGDDRGLSVEQAVHAWTRDAAEASDLGRRGRLEVGAPADLVLVAGPLRQAPHQARVTHTVIDGRIGAAPHP